MIQQLIDGRTDLVFELIEQGHPADTTDANGRPLIKWCAYYGDVSAIKFLLSHGADLEDLGVNYDLNGAAFHGHWQLVQFLLERGADVHYVLPFTGETALHACLCKANRPSTNHIVKLLLKAGAYANARTLPHRETGSFMRDAYTRQETPLHRAAAFGNAETIEILLEAGADKSIKDMHGESPLSWASWHLRPGKILSLLAYDDHRIHPLHIQRMQKDHGHGGPCGLELNLLGEVHV